METKREGGVQALSNIFNCGIFSEESVTCENKENTDILIEDAAKTFLPDDLVSQDKTGDGERQASKQNEREHCGAVPECLQRMSESVTHYIFPIALML